MLQIQNLSYHIGQRQLLNNIDWTITPGSRIGLIGPNGAGKTTLLRLLVGELRPLEGSITKAAEYTIGYLPQEETDFGSGSVLSLAMTGQQELLDMEKEIASIHKNLEERSGQQAPLLQKLGALEARFGVLGGYELEARAKKILVGLGFTENDFSGSLSDLSGGWRMRVYLARLLLQEPHLLLLDEPTNHLDMESLEWLESYLRSFKGSLVIVSHDRFFIDRLADEIAELFHSRLTLYRGGYHFYEKQKALFLEQALKKAQEQKAERERLEKFINRFRYKASKAPQVQSRIKRLEKLEKIELPEQQKSIHFKIRADVQSYKEVLQLENVSFRYQSDWVFENIDLHMTRGDKVALVGINGAGKTTLTRLISGELSPQKGQIRLGERVHIAYYAQHHSEALDMNQTVFDQVQATAAPSLRPHVRDILGIFRFSGDDAQKKAAVLSGGEKARVSLAKILISPGNFLIMDEPTNHLDQQSKEALEQALADYDGTLLLISHDRYFLDKLVSRVIELKDGNLRVFEGNYSAYLDKRETALPGSNPAERTSGLPEAEKNKGRLKKTKEQKQKEALARQTVSGERRELTRKIEVLEKTIDDLEIKKQELERVLAEPQTYQNPQKAAELKKEYESLLAKIAFSEQQWEQAQLRFELVMNTIK